MSVHTLVATAYLEDLDPGTKLVLMALADSADERSGHTAPGMPKLRAWSGRSKSQVMRIIKDLEDRKYLSKVSPGRIGQRATWCIFPDGMPAIPHPEEVAARYSPPAFPTPVDNPETEVRARATLESGEGRILAQEGRTAMRPLQSYPSVSSAPRRQNPGRRPVGSGFPGALSANTARNPAPTRCGEHPDQVMPCSPCNREAEKVSEAYHREAAAQLRAMMQRNASARPLPPRTPDR